MPVTKLNCECCMRRMYTDFANNVWCPNTQCLLFNKTYSYDFIDDRAKARRKCQPMREDEYMTFEQQQERLPRKKLRLGSTLYTHNKQVVVKLTKKTERLYSFRVIFSMHPTIEIDDKLRINPEYAEVLYYQTYRDRVNLDRVE